MHVNNKEMGQQMKNQRSNKQEFYSSQAILTDQAKLATVKYFPALPALLAPLERSL